MAISKEAQNVLVRAAELIGIKENWIQGQGFNTKDGDRHGSYCAMGALHRAAVELGYACYGASSNASNEAIEAVVRKLNKLCPEATSIPQFNDHIADHAAIKALFCETVKAEVTDDGTE